MGATPIRGDRPPERALRLVRHSVQRRLRSPLVEARVQSLGRVERPPHGAVRVARQPPLLLDLDFQLIPTHEHMFAYPPDGRRTPLSPESAPRRTPSRSAGASRPSRGARTGRCPATSPPRTSRRAPAPSPTAPARKP